MRWYQWPSPNIMNSFLRYCALETGEIKHVSEIRKFALDYLNVSEEDRKAMLPSNTQRLVDNRVNWSITYLRKANLIERVARGKYKITNTGLQVLHEKKDHVELKDLYQFDSFRQFINTDTMSEEKKDLSKPSVLEDLQEGTPQDNLNASMEQINKELSANLLSEIMERSPAFFEKMVVQLLLKMGYGSALEDGFVTGCSGDEGIDGIIREG